MLAPAMTVGQPRDEYNEDTMIGLFVDKLSQIELGPTEHWNVPFSKAYNAMMSWSKSDDINKGNALNLDQLTEAIGSAALAINSVCDPVDKINALFLLIHATYFFVAFTTKSWAASKKEAQALLEQYIGNMKGVKTAARRELERLAPFAFNKAPRRTLLCAVMNLSDDVFVLHPVSENDSHPRFPDVNKAVIHACGQDSGLMRKARIRHILTEPVLRETLKGHTDSIFCCAISKSGTKALSRSRKTLKVWDLKNGKKIHTIKEHTPEVRCCAVFVNCTKALLGSHFGWDRLLSRKEYSRIEGDTKGVTCCAVFDNDMKALSGSDDKTLKVWDLSNSTVLETLTAHTDTVTCCAVFDNGTKALSGSDDKTLKVWDLSNSTVLVTFTGHTKTVTCCAVFDNGTKALSGSRDKTLKVWDLNGTETCTLTAHTDAVTCCAVFENDTEALSGSDDKTLLVWDLSNSMVLGTLEGHKDSVTCCAVFDNGTKALSGSCDKTLKVWDLLNFTVIGTLTGHTRAVTCCAVFDNGAKAFSGSSDKTLKVWDLPMTFGTN